MDTASLKRFAQQARKDLIEQVSTKLRFVLAEGSLARRESASSVAKIEEIIRSHGEQYLIERVAYIWFNRFSALRFMDVNHYTRIGVVSPAEGQTQPEILAEAKMGHIDDAEVPSDIRTQILDLLNNRAPSADPQTEAYRLLLVATCNHWFSIMPFLFQRIDDYTQLLMPENLLSSSSILVEMRNVMTAEVCQDVEVIGWLYQFYISDKKDDVFAGLKKNKKVTPENIPAATQLFTPHWIVRYLVENSLGRLWLLNNPDSNLADSMEYYIKPAAENDESDFLKVNSPEELKICDPACGSGHMLTYAFDLLYKIYEEEGYDASEIPSLILTHNLYGIELDERAGELAAFALTMKARAKHRRFFSKKVRPNICVLEPIKFEQDELTEYMDFVGRDLFTKDFEKTLTQFEEADNFGSLIRPELTDVDEILEHLEQKDVSGQLFLSDTHNNVLTLLKQAKYLSPRYHVVVANPPYMGGNGMNTQLKSWAAKNYPDSNSDLFAMFIERGLELIPSYGYSAMVTMQSWMFLSSYEKLRNKLANSTCIQSLVHMANMVMGIAFGTSATVWKLDGSSKHLGSYCYVEYEDLSKEFKPKKFPPQNNRNSKASDDRYTFYHRLCDFRSIPGQPIAYWASNSLTNLFSHPSISEISETRLGMATANNNLFLRQWFEINKSTASLDSTSREQAKESEAKWFPYQKGGVFRKWYGNLDYLVNWKNDGERIRNYSNEETGKIRSHNYNLDYIFKEGVTWNALTSYKTSARISRNSLFDNAGSSLFPKNQELENPIMAYLNSNIIIKLMYILSPTLNYQPGDIGKLPAYFLTHTIANINAQVSRLLDIAKKDWDSYETSWDFTTLPFLENSYRKSTLADTYKQLRSHWQQMTEEMQKLEEENNRIFIDAYGLQDELTPDVPLKEITLTCNPHYRYGGDRTDEELEQLLLADTMREFISYAVGCMFGRYSLDKPGLILANQGDDIDDYYAQIPSPTFAPDKDNVLPILDGNWFTDDIVDNFRRFVKVTFGEDHYDDNIQFIEMALGKNGKPKDIRDYFLKDFYNDHIRRYKKRPIYWMFSSGSFNALIYMHRYRPDTVSVVLNSYLREFRTKLDAQKSRLEAISISSNSSQSEKTKAEKEIYKIDKTLMEIDAYERDTLYPLATKQVEIDLDDGVKQNYPKLGDALKKVTGLS
ncbi:BREX-1 system adenine-specific DNA-methyltransferase PglX [Psychrobacter raelei]|uniref:BREX-1 system adenine-specific DNA-methyltransferase PglX n=1 Tax=Psychrobacter raelei TaxID=2565531 RepID=UPI003F5E0847